MLVHEREQPCAAPALEVWKLLHDPERFPEWWAGLSRVEIAAGQVTCYFDEHPEFDFPMRLTPGAGGVVISCQRSDIDYRWSLRPAAVGCVVAARVEVPAAAAEHLEEARTEIDASLPRLVAAAERATG